MKKLVFFFVAFVVLAYTVAAVADTVATDSVVAE